MPANSFSIMQLKLTDITMSEFYLLALGKFMVPLIMKFWGLFIKLIFEISWILKHLNIIRRTNYHQLFDI